MLCLQRFTQVGYKWHWCAKVAVQCMQLRRNEDGSGELAVLFCLRFSMYDSTELRRAASLSR